MRHLTPALQRRHELSPMVFSRIAVLALLLALPLSVQAYTATLRYVVDGDTIVVTDRQGKEQHIRIAGIDAPEKAQAFGSLAKDHLKRLFSGSRTVEIDPRAVDQYGRTIARVLTAPGKCSHCAPTEDLGLAQVSAGYAWWYRQESRQQPAQEREDYALAEEAARARRHGLWAEVSPVPPWQWRREHKEEAQGPLAKAERAYKQTKRVVLHPVRSLKKGLGLKTKRHKRGSKT